MDDDSGRGIELPEPVRNLVEEALASARTGEVVQWGVAHRQALFDALAEEDSAAMERTRGWVVVLAARHVLPIYLAAMEAVQPGRALVDDIVELVTNAYDWTAPYAEPVRRLLETLDTSDPLVQKVAAETRRTIAQDMDTLDDEGRKGLQWGIEAVDVVAPLCACMAELIMDGTLDAGTEAVKDARELGYNSFGQAFDYAPLAPRYAANAAFAALLQAAFGDGTMIEQTDIEAAREEDWGDASGLAAIACASVEGNYDPYEDEVDSARLGQFWKWWLSDALPQAWRRAHEHTPTS